MKVKAKYELAYNNKLYKAGDVFEINEAHIEQFKNDVLPVDGKAKKSTDKQLKKADKVKKAKK
jgi:uncharacterized surface anchored protein